MGAVAEGLKGLVAAMKGLIPAKVEVENLLQDMEALEVFSQ